MFNIWLVETHKNTEIVSKVCFDLKKYLALYSSEPLAVVEFKVCK